MKQELRWVYLAHLGYNMWYEPLEDKLGVRCPDSRSEQFPYIHATDKMRFEKSRWQILTQQLKDAGCNTILLDLGEGLRYESHPELAIEGSWSKLELAEELARLRRMGFEVLPKLNFSACHDEWLGEYGRMVSTSLYYKVANDLISEVTELFDGPELFHLGMDEETFPHQKHNNIVMIRQGDQWWYDLKRLAGSVRSAGSRPWIWSDYGWDHWEEFRNRMDKDILQSNWYYHLFAQKAPQTTHFGLYEKLDEAGFDQIPTGSSYADPENFALTVDHCGGRISREHLKGFMQTVWCPVMEETGDRLDLSVNCLAEGVRRYRG